ncbi:hypothetical protein BMULJ_02652 [Burkholderia multivorans ATCC 17616]|uniref:Uncharacterized protein n=1 Tax=Burkholderia multivorans (strain ATCC 17616 / 249) TaxID=395019 RepID=A0A0H3KR70_BURM1|nr:hypothetical protein BMULJ_02652 [Burkholderia multivorans ATCC 17616]
MRAAVVCLAPPAAARLVRSRAAAGNQCVFRAGRNSPPAVGRRQPTSPRAPAQPRGVSRSGRMPEPTVTVRMREDVQIVTSVRAASRRMRSGLSFCLFAMP